MFYCSFIGSAFGGVVVFFVGYSIAFEYLKTQVDGSWVGIGLLIWEVALVYFFIIFVCCFAGMLAGAALGRFLAIKFN